MSRHDELKAQWAPGQIWETLVEGCSHWVLVGDSGRAQPVWDDRQEYRRVAVPAETPNPAVAVAMERLQHVDAEIWDDIDTALKEAIEGHCNPCLDELDCNLLRDLVRLYRTAPAAGVQR